MAASVIRTLSGFGASLPAQSCYIPPDEDELEDECEEELRDEVEVEDGFEEDEEESSGVESHVTDLSASDLYTEMTDRLLRFAELISSDVQRYFGRNRDSETCDLYAGRSRAEVNGRHRYYSDIIRVTSSEQAEEPKNLGPLAELFQNTQVKKQGLPMIQRRLPSSFWNEPLPQHPGVSADVPDLPSRSTQTINTTCSVPLISMSSSTTPDFSDLLAHWASDRDNNPEFTCEYTLT
ncbi:protein PERCC1 [Silurus meridionalis]|uniref:Uncharacterized protein n=1 Tax=Silurus meridionalis TaxID=175797 RepID=A0A8T0AFG1_SILME